MTNFVYCSKSCWFIVNVVQNFSTMSFKYFDWRAIVGEELAEELFLDLMQKNYDYKLNARLINVLILFIQNLTAAWEK